jgi:hypothetical protein
MDELSAIDQKILALKSELALLENMPPLVYEKLGNYN